MAEFQSIRVFRTDVVREEEGVWIGITPAGIDGPRAKLARWGNKQFVDLQRELGIKYSSELTSADEKVKEEATTRMYAELVANAIVKDVKGLSLDDETEWKYTPESALEVFCDPGYHDLLEFIERKAQDSTNFRPDPKPSVKDEKAAAGTLKKASSSTKK